MSLPGPPGASVSDAAPSKGATAVELFFDLIFVFAVTQTSELLQLDHSLPGVLRAVVVFVPVFWLWVGATMFSNLTEPDSARGRPVLFLLSGAAMVMALALPEAYGDRAWMFALGYRVGRSVLWAAVARHPHRSDFITIPIGAVLTGPLLLLGAFLEPGPRSSRSSHDRPLRST